MGNENSVEESHKEGAGCAKTEDGKFPIGTKKGVKLEDWSSLLEDTRKRPEEPPGGHVKIEKPVEFDDRSPVEQSPVSRSGKLPQARATTEDSGRLQQVSEPPQHGNTPPFEQSPNDRPRQALEVRIKTEVQPRRSNATQKSTIHPRCAVRPSYEASGPGAVKRNAPLSAFSDRRRQTLPKIQKVTRESVSAQSPVTVERGGQSSSASERIPPDWYNKIPTLNSRNRDESTVDTFIRSLRSKITQTKKPQPNRASGSRNELFSEILAKIHKIAYVEVNAQLLKQTRILHSQEGLPQLFDTRYSGGVDWPWYLKADAEELYIKWCREIFETDIMRGIKFQVKSRGKDEGGNSIDPNFPTASSKYHGNGDLINGQWWPLQICLLRDGAHGATQSGISGATGKGAYSVVMSGGHDYPDEDHGDWVLYCGTDNNNRADNTPSPATSRLVESVEGDNPVRLIRSHNLNSPYAPEKGFRYDGLYDAVSYEIIKAPPPVEQRHRFRLERRAGQDPIRGGSGPESRPTEEELEAYAKHEVLSGKKRAKNA